MTETKVCKTCKQEKPLSDFSQYQSKKFSFNPNCKPCDAKRAREMRADKRARGFCSCGRVKADGDEFKCTWCREWKTRYNKEESRKRVTAWRARTPLAKVRSKQRNKDKKIKVLIAYGGLKCSCDGCTVTHLEFLTIDHIEGGGRKHRKEVNQHVYAWLIKNDFPPGFRVLCMNCNFAKGIYGFCPHERNSESIAVHAETIETIKLP